MNEAHFEFEIRFVVDGSVELFPDRGLSLIWLDPLDDHSTDLIWIPPHSSLWHLQLLSCKVCLIRVSQSRGALHETEH